METDKHTDLVTSLKKPLRHRESCSVKVYWKTKSPLCIDSLPHLQRRTTPEHGHETVTQKQNTFCRFTLGFVNIKNRDLTHLAHHTKQYQTHNTMCHYKGINDLLNQVFVSSVQQKRYTVLCGIPDLWDTVHSQAHFSTVTCWVGKVENITSAQQTLAIS